MEFLMIVKFDEVPCNNVASLFAYVGSGENRELVEGATEGQWVVRIKSVQQGSGPNHFNVTLDCLEWISVKMKSPTMRRISDMYITKIYEIVGMRR